MFIATTVCHFLCMQAAVWADPGLVRGKIIDVETKEDVGFVNVSIYREGSPELLKGTTSDESGMFRLENLEEGDYTLVASYIGYKEVRKDIRITPAYSDVNVGLLLLEEDPQVLGEVQVVGQKSQMRFDLDKKVFDVDQNIASTGGSASDVLTNIPSVEVDNEGQISLRGNSSVTVWINGKASGLTSDNRRDILEQLPAESIERIEVITNPSSRYSPEGTAGIINIILKRDRRAGYYGGLQLGANTEGGYNGSGNINYSSGMLEAYANVGYRRTSFNSGGYMNRNYLSDDGEENSFLRQDTEGDMDGHILFTRAGLTWNISDKNRLGLAGMGMFGGHDRRNRICYLSTEDGNTLYDRLRNQDEDGDMTLFNVELNYTHTFSENSDLDLTLSHNQWNLDTESVYDDVTRYADDLEETLYQSQDTGAETKRGSCSWITRTNGRTGNVWKRAIRVRLSETKAP